MYLVSRSISLPNIQTLQKEMIKDPNYLEETTAKINQLIHTYFQVEDEGKFFITLDDIEVKMVGDKDLRDEMLPLKFIESNRQKSEIDVSLFSLSRPK